MALQPVTRRSVPEEVFEQIAADVLSGEMQPGEALPSERRLADVLGELDASAAGAAEARLGEVERLPSGSALLVVKRGPTAGSRLPVVQVRRRYQRHLSQP